MIFVTVGTDMPFDRMIKVIDRWAAETACSEVFAQIGRGGWQPHHIRFAEFLQPPQFVQAFTAARVILSHAGMGTILSALYYGKPILVMPKRACLGEHRSEHQLATAKRMLELGHVNVAFDEVELRDHLDHLDRLRLPERIGSAACDSLLGGLSRFIHGLPVGVTENRLTPSAR